jgi:hypothetical protein
MSKTEQQYSPIIELLEEDEFLKSISREYKGFLNYNNPFIHKPKVLFIGINPGEGAYLEKNSIKSNKPQYPKRLISNGDLTQIDWLKDGVSRGEFNKQIQKGYKWYERTKKINNQFPKRMIEFFFEYYDLNDKSDFSEIENRINSEIFYHNLYPIATKSTTELNTILKKIVPRLATLNGKDIKNKNDLKNFFRQRTIDLIKEIQPDNIVCLGIQAFKELTFSNQKLDTNNPKKTYKTSFRQNDKDEYPVYVISRNGNWEGKVKELGKHLR